MIRRHEHPLDIDLLAYAAGDIDGSAVSMIEDHLRGCLLCRIRLGRIRRHDTSVASPPLDAARPSVPTALLDALDPDRRAPAPGAGQVWLAGRELRVLVWIRTSTDRALTAHLVTIDITRWTTPPSSSMRARQSTSLLPSSPLSSPPSRLTHSSRTSATCR